MKRGRAKAKIADAAEETSTDKKTKTGKNTSAKSTVKADDATATATASASATGAPNDEFERVAALFQVRMRSRCSGLLCRRCLRFGGVWSFVRVVRYAE